MRNKMKGIAAEKLAHQLELPGELISGAPLMELRGFGELYIENHKGISSYSDESIVVRVKGGEVSVEGSGLSVGLMNRRELLLRGEISSLSFIRR